MKKTFKNILLWITSAFMFLCVIAGVALTPKTASAAGTDDWKTTGVFEMDDGASLKLGNVGGLRFIVRMDETVYNFVVDNEDAELGFVIAPKNLMLAANGDYLNMPKKIGGAVDKTKVYQDGDYWLANGCVTNVKAANLERSFTAVAYIKCDGEVRYTEYNDLARNNLYDAVNAAVLSGKYTEELFTEKAGGYVQSGENEGWYGSEQYPIVVESDAEYDNFVDVINATNSNTQYHAVIKNDATTNKVIANTNPETAPIIKDASVDELNKLIVALPDSVTMPDAIGQVGRIRDAEKKYNALSDAKKEQVSNYAKVESLLTAIEGYDRVYKNDATDGTVIPSYVPGGFSSAIGGSATTRTDALCGNVLTVTSAADGRAALHFQNFPSIEKYAKIYFYARILDISCDIYLSDGIANDGWGNDWNNTWSTSGFWCNANTWRLLEIDLSDADTNNDYINGDFALGFRAQVNEEKVNGFTFEISDFYGIVKEFADTKTLSSLRFGTISDTGTTNEYGQVYNISREQWFVDENNTNTIGSLSAGKLANNLPEGQNFYYFWMYNPTDTAYSFHLAGDCSGTWTDSKDTFALTPKAWTKITISAEDIELNKQGQWYVYILGGDGQGAAKDGWQISPIYADAEVVYVKQEVQLTFGVMADTGATNEYGKVYNISRGAWYVENNVNNTMGDFGAGALANALPEGYEYFYFWMYNPTDTVYSFHIAGGSAWTDSADSYSLAAKAWTKVTISAADIEMAKAAGTWYVYILGGDGAGAAADGWQISTIYAGPDKVVELEHNYYDHADVKEVLALINAIPETVTLSDKAAVEAARAAYNKLKVEAQAMVSNYSKLTAAETTIADLENANEVIALIDAINANDLDEAAVVAARVAYNELSDSAKTFVTNIEDLEAYEETISNDKDLQTAVDNVNTLIANLPDSVVMPNHLVFVARIEAAQEAYNALSAEGKVLVGNYAKLRTLVSAIKGYDAIYTQTVDGVDVVPSHVPNYTSTIGGTASLGYDGYYGTYLKVTPDAGGKVAIQFKNFPDVTQYTKIYFNIRVVGASCDIYLSDGIANGGWGDDWHNTWSMDGFYANNGNWIQKEVDVSTGIFSSNWALGLRTDTTGVSFEIADIVGYKSDLGNQTTASFGTVTDSGTVNEYGPINNLEQAWTSPISLGSFNQGDLRSALSDGHDSLRFWIYNPNESDLNCWVEETTGWTKLEDLETLNSKGWTKVVLGPSLIAENDKVGLCINVASGAGTAGWQISHIYSYSSTEVEQDAIYAVQSLIDALDTSNIDEAAVTAARKAYEALAEHEKEFTDIDNLSACETALYGDVANAPFIVDGASNYKIYNEKDSRAAATFMRTQLKSATGVELPRIESLSANVTKYRYAIVFGYESLYAGLGLNVPTEEELGRAGYQIVKLGRAVFIFAYSADGYRMATLKFLNETVGYDMLAEDCVYYDTSKVGTLPEFNVIGKPFDYRQKQTALTDEEAYGMGIQPSTELWIASPEGWDMHNTLHYLPKETYQSAHPAWFYTYTDSINESRTQICPTAGGSSTEFNAMVETIAANMLVQINAYPEKENISFSIMDTADNDDCQCARCKLYDTLYGEGGFAAAWIDLMNAVNAKVRESLPDGRVLNIAFLAYRGTEKAPASIDGNGNVTLMKRYQINDDGSYTQTSEDLKCDEGVTVWLAPINGYYAENFNHADNAETLATIKKWSTISNSVYLWMYGTNFKFYMYPYNTWKASAENYKILKELDVKAAWSQSNQTEATAFTDLKAYIDSKFMADVNADYETVLNTYFTRYFGAGATEMRAFFDKVVARCDEIEAEYDGLGRGIYDELENVSGFLGIGAKTYWEKSWLDECVTLCDEAKAAIDADTILTDAQKTAFKNRITKESLFPRYVLCTTFANKYSSSVKKSMRQAFKADADALGFTLYREADGDLSKLYSDWGI